MGGRTLWMTQDGRQWINVRRLLDFVKRSTKIGNRWAVQEVNDPSLWTKLRTSNQAFCRGMWQDGMLFPSDDESQAYFVKCDRENNPVEQRKLGRVWIYIGVNPPYPAEFVIIKVSQWDGGAGVTEEIA
jgi:phage tail sheath protein FI